MNNYDCKIGKKLLSSEFLSKWSFQSATVDRRIHSMTNYLQVVMLPCHYNIPLHRSMVQRAAPTRSPNSMILQRVSRPVWREEASKRVMSSPCIRPTAQNLLSCSLELSDAEE